MMAMIRLRACRALDLHELARAEVGETRPAG
jgi:hypothetical protein